MEVGLVAVVVLLFRIVAFVVLGVLKLFSILFLVPLFAPRRNRRQYTHTRGHPKPVEDHPVFQLIRAVRAGVDDHYAAQVVTPPKATAVPRGTPQNRMFVAEVSRDQRDCAMALKQLGFQKQQAESYADAAVRALGPDAKFDDLVKHALQQAGRGR